MAAAKPETRKTSKLARWALRLRLSRIKLILLGVAGLFVITGTSIFVYYYVHFARMIDARLAGNVFDNSSVVYAAPTEIQVGDAATPAALAARLRRAGYIEGEGGSVVGTYRLAGGRAGEGLHNNHHSASTSAHLAQVRGEHDPAWVPIRIARRLGWLTVRHEQPNLLPLDPSKREKVAA